MVQSTGLEEHPLQTLCVFQYPRVLKCYFHHGAARTTWGYCCLLAALVSAWLHCISHK